MTSLREPQLGQPLAGHLRPDHLVVVEGHLPAGQQRPGPRLADVVQDRGQPQHQVAAPARTAAPGRSPGAARSASACRRPCAGGARRPPSAARAAPAAPCRPRRCATSRSRPYAGSAASISLVSSSVIRSADTIDSRDACAPHRRLHLGGDREPEPGREPRGAQDPQRVVGERVLRPPWRPDHPLLQRGEPAERIDQLVRRQPGRHRVDREVAPDQVLLQRRPVPARRACATAARTPRCGRW